jgi:hypothetical protein
LLCFTILGKTIVLSKRDKLLAMLKWHFPYVAYRTAEDRYDLHNGILLSPAEATKIIDGNITLDEVIQLRKSELK